MRNGALALEPLERRETPTVSAITSNFNGTAIAEGSTVWFNSVAKVSGLPAAGTTLHVTHQTVSFNGTVLDLPDTTLTLSPDTAAADATTGFNGGWVTNAPKTFSGNVFLGGVGFAVPATIPGGSVKAITWSGDFQSDVPGVTVSWKWAAAVYTTFNTDPGQLGVKPLDTRTTQYQNSDHAGTPEAYKGFVVGGARGGGGSNFTGSYSGTKAVVTDQFIVEPPVNVSSLSGWVFRDTDFDGVTDTPEAGATLALYDSAGNLVDTTTTGDGGSYSFGGLTAGTYRIELQATGLVQSTAGLIDGSGDGTADGTVISGIELGGDQHGLEYNFQLFSVRS